MNSSFIVDLKRTMEREMLYPVLGEEGKSSKQAHLAAIQPSARVLFTLHTFGGTYYEQSTV